MTTPTPAQHAAIAAIHQRTANENPSCGWTDVAVLTALEYAEKVTRERDEARRLVEELRGVDNLHPLTHN